MHIRPRTEPYILWGGDLLLWATALWFALLARDFSPPQTEIFLLHIAPFAILFIFWSIVFFISDLYKTPTLLSAQALPRTLFNAQAVNSVVAIFFFYFIPYFQITPKTILFLQLVFSFLFIALWRLVIALRFKTGKRKTALLIGSGPDVDALVNEVNTNQRYHFCLEQKEMFVFDEVLEAIQKRGVNTIIIDTHGKESLGITRELYDLLFANATFVDLNEFFEEVFGRVPLTHLHDNWFIENITVTPKRLYDATKRATDIIIASVFGLLSLVLYPFIAGAIYLEDRGSPFIKQTRAGKGFRPIHLYKFRSMTRNEESIVSGNKENHITRVGAFLRKTRLDELPQLWNVLRGDLSLIGPRPELYEAVRVYAENIPYYPARLLILPGLSGWAQIYHDAHPHHTTDITETKNKLSYDLYYIKNRSVFLDFKIALKTLKTLISHSGR